VEFVEHGRRRCHLVKNGIKKRKPVANELNTLLSTSVIGA
jgi:hypothetical protein